MHLIQAICLIVVIISYDKEKRKNKQLTSILKIGFKDSIKSDNRTDKTSGSNANLKE